MTTTKNIILKDQYGETSINQIVSPGTVGQNEIFTGNGVPTFSAPAGSVYFQGDASDSKSIQWVNPTSGVNWVLSAATDTNPNVSSVMSTDFTGGTPGGFVAIASGTSAGVQADDYGVNNTEKAMGVYKGQTGSDTTGRAAIMGGLDNLRVGSQAISLGFRAALQQLSNGTDTFAVRIGLQNNFGVSVTNGIYFLYTHGTNGGRWQCVVNDNGTVVSADSGVVADTTYMSFEIMVNLAGTQAIFKIDGVVVATVNAGLPTTARLFNWGAIIQKSAGTTNANLDYDWAYLQLTGIGR